MADTFSKIYIQVIFSVSGRKSLINPDWEDELHKYLTGIIQAKNQKVIAINGTRDHIHIFIGMKPTCCLSDLVREVKKSSSAFIKKKRLSPYYFSWQNGFGAFSYGHSQLDQVIHYINYQKEHHKKRTFREEYIDFLKKFSVDFNDDYLFEWIEDFDGKNE